MTPVLTITRGLPASGKTTWSHNYVKLNPGTIRVNRDDLRCMMYGTRAGLTFEQEQDITRTERGIADAALRSGQDVVVDAMNLRPKYVREWRKLAHLRGAVFDIEEFPIDVEDAIRRDTSREHSIGEDAIRGIAGKYLPAGQFLPVPDETEPLPTDTYTPPAGKPMAVMCDIDGTAALMGDRNPYDLTTVGQDTANESVLITLQGLDERGLTVIYCSGRSEDARDATQEWLDHNWFPAGPLLMRASGDQRRDAIVKRELFDEHIRHNYSVTHVIDDRQQVVDMWRDLGLTVHQVAPGDF